MMDRLRESPGDGIEVVDPARVVLPFRRHNPRPPGRVLVAVDTPRPPLRERESLVETTALLVLADPG